ncbi:MAG: Asp-tRNA(Asn)/Glu-tRNA(Gln) amidotransferase subunit GatB [Chloroflexota bacterium]
MNFETIIGLEVHVQLLTQSKMFCRCSADYAQAQPNTHVCPVCLGMPGVLPTINQRAVAYTIMTALALNCSVSSYTKFDRKNYPYPDLMKGYQISQYDAPIGKGGALSFEVKDVKKTVGITRVHLEEDVAKLMHHTSPLEEHYSLVDVNRSGVPLMEVVGEPDMRSPEDARQYLMKLHSILQYLGVSTANMDEGSFRCDANISIRPEGSAEFMSKVEVKNMNSFRAVYRALEYEARRQREVVAAGGRIAQETRGWIEEKGETFSQRSKEYAHDYRYFPEPDLPPLMISPDWVAEIKAKLPELPEARRDRFVAEFGLSLYDASLLTGLRATADYFEDCLKTEEANRLPADRRAKEVANWMLGEVTRIINAAGIETGDFRAKVSPESLCALILASHGTINNTTAKSVLEEMFRSGHSAESIIRERGLGQIGSAEELEKVATKIITDNPQAVADYQAGKETAIKFLVGQVMKATKGRADPKLSASLLVKTLTEKSSKEG